MKSRIKPNDWFRCHTTLFDSFPSPVYLCTEITSDGYIRTNRHDGCYHPTAVVRVNPDEVAHTSADIYMALQLATMLIEESDATGYDLLNECMIELTYR